jgi:hypothetical protein
MTGAIVLAATTRRGSADPMVQAVSANPRLAKVGAVHG